MATLTRRIITVKLPSFDNPEDPVSVKVFDKVVAGDYDDMPESDKPRDAMYWIYSQIIQEWDLKAEDGTSLPITPENIRLLPMNDISAIREATGMDKQISDTKKNS